MVKILIIRFSSFGDVTQTLSVPSKLKTLGGEVHWVTRADFAPLLLGHPNIGRVWLLEKNSGSQKLFALARQLRAEKYSHVYDAHNNLRSHVLCFFLRCFSRIHFLRKSQKRWKRFLLFRLRINTYRQPFSGQRDLLEPLSAWGIDESLPPTPQIFISSQAREFIQQWRAQRQIRQYVCFAPSAAHPLKRWPLENWQKLIALNQNLQWVALGGPEDVFIETLRSQFPNSMTNMAGQTDYQQTAALIAQSQCLVTNDTGALHIGEQLGHPVLALMGPAPFGFPSRPSTQVLQVDLPCRPCSKHGQGPCINSTFQLCLKGIAVPTVHAQLQAILKAQPPAESGL